MLIITVYISLKYKVCPGVLGATAGCLYMYGEGTNIHICFKVFSQLFLFNLSQFKMESPHIVKILQKSSLEYRTSTSNITNHILYIWIGNFLKFCDKNSGDLEQFTKTDPKYVLMKIIILTKQTPMQSPN